MMLTFCLTTAVQAQTQTLTIGSPEEYYSPYFPIYGYWLDEEGTLSQTIIPADLLTDMNGGTISKMAFYTLASYYLSTDDSYSPENGDWLPETGTVFSVALSEVEEGIFSESSEPSGYDHNSLTEVYHGTFLEAISQLEIEFDNPYQYHGGNLLVSIIVVEAGEWNSCKWVGVSDEETNLSYCQYNYFGELHFETYTFMPKTTFTYVPATTEPCAAPNDVTVVSGTTSATVSWTGSSEQYNVQYLHQTFYCGAEDDENLDDWFYYDVDGDGNGWGTLSDEGRDGSTAFVSNSYYSGALDPDNWLITPVIDLGGTMSVWMKSHSSYWPDNFAIYIITDPDWMDNVDLNNLEDEFTLLIGETTAPAEYTEYTADLSAYAGMQGRIAIRHFNSYDQYRLYMDDFSVNGQTLLSNVSSPVEITGLVPASPISVQVQAVCPEGTSEWTDPVYAATHGLCDAPSGLEASNVTGNTSTLEWTGYQDNYNIKYAIMPINIDTLFFEDFENGLPADWTTIDNDGDGYNWIYFNNAGLETGRMSAHSGDGLVYSESYYKPTYQPLTPDNWLITPLIDLNGTMKVWLIGQDPSYASEHFAIYLSTTGTTVDDFTTTLVSEQVATGEYVEYTADLSAYAGQQGYIAIRHFNTYDMFRLNVDDFGVFTDPWTTVTSTGNPTTLTGLDPETTYQVQVQGICEDGSTTEWSDVVEFTTTEETEPIEPIEPGECGLAEDCEGTSYPTVKIGDLCWMQKNLAAESCVTSGNVYAYVNDQFPDEDANVAAYGLLYDEEAAMQGVVSGAKAEAAATSICPDGYRLPTVAEIEALGAAYTADELKSTNYWIPGGGGTDAAGLGWLPGGCYNDNTGRFESMLLEGYLWATEEVNGETQPAMYKITYYCSTILMRVENFEGLSASVRCVKDAGPEPEPETFTCGDNLIIGENSYPTVQIGTQCWTKTNMRETPAGATDGTSSGASNTTEPYYYVNPNVDATVYGYYYNWEAAKLVCPEGWHLPSNDEWTQLTNYVGSQSEYTCNGNSNYIAQALAIDEEDYWDRELIMDDFPCQPAYDPSKNNKTGFSAVPVGYWYPNFLSERRSTYFWSSSEYDEDNAWRRGLSHLNESVSGFESEKDRGFSVRCLRNE